MIQESDGTGAPTASYVLGDTELLTQTRGTTTNYYLHDGQNSVRALTDVTGNITDSYLYDAYGNSSNTRQGATVNPYQYTGQQFDSMTGLYDLRARYYNFKNGTFLSRDPELDWDYYSSKLNIYQYAGEIR